MTEGANQDIRNELERNGFCLWELAYELGIAYCHLTRKLSIELDEDMKKLMFDAIERMKKTEG